MPPAPVRAVRTVISERAQSRTPRARLRRPPPYASAHDNDPRAQSAGGNETLCSGLDGLSPA
jgi:hypothetical protein